MHQLNLKSGEFFSIDGSFGEGGGSVLRLASAFSIVTQRPIKIFNIRKNRPNPGLRTQHLVGLQSLAKLSNGKLSHVKVGTDEITFEPGKIKSQSLDINIATAGSIGLLLQAIQIACINSKSEIQLNIDGGATFGKWAPTLMYLQNVTFKILEKMGFITNLDIIKDGFYPKGGAMANVTINAPDQLKPIQLTELGSIESINGVSIASNFLRSQNVAERQAKTAKEIIKNKLNTSVQIRSKYVDSLSPGSGICIWLTTNTGVILGSDYVGEKKVSSEIVGRRCAELLIETYKRGATCDKFLSDQILPFMAMAGGSSTLFTPDLTNHARTNILLAERFIKRKFFIENVHNLTKISC